MINACFTAPGTPESHVESLRFLTVNGIEEKYDLNQSQIERIRNELRGKTLREILWAYPDGAHFDVLLNLIGTLR